MSSARLANLDEMNGQWNTVVSIPAFERSKFCGQVIQMYLDHSDYQLHSRLLRQILHMKRQFYLLVQNMQIKV